MATDQVATDQEAAIFRNTAEEVARKKADEDKAAKQAARDKAEAMQHGDVTIFCNNGRNVKELGLIAAALEMAYVTKQFAPSDLSWRVATGHRIEVL